MTVDTLSTEFLPAPAEEKRADAPSTSRGGSVSRHEDPRAIEARKYPAEAAVDLLNKIVPDLDLGEPELDPRGGWTNEYKQKVIDAIFDEEHPDRKDHLKKWLETQGEEGVQFADQFFPPDGDEKAEGEGEQEEPQFTEEEKVKAEELNKAAEEFLTNPSDAEAQERLRAEAPQVGNSDLLAKFKKSKIYRKHSQKLAFVFALLVIMGAVQYGVAEGFKRMGGGGRRGH